MAHNWQGTRAAELPHNWADIRRTVQRRAQGQCEGTSPTTHQRCTTPGTECHHAGNRTDHRIEALQWLCTECHDTETQRQAHEAQLVIIARAKHPRHRLAYLTQRVGPDRAADLMARVSRL